MSEAGTDRVTDAEPISEAANGPVEEPAAPPPDRSSGIRGAAQALVTFGPPVSILTALLVYFGWARSSVEARALGLDESVLGLSTQDYVLRSIDSLFQPITVIAAVTLAWLLIHQRVMTVIAEGERLDVVRWISRGLVAGFAVVPLLAWIAARIWPAWRGLVIPLSFTVGVLLTAYGLTLLRALPTDRPAPAAPAWQRSLAAGCVGVLIATTLFWELSNFAGVVGNGLAARIAAHVHDRAGVVLYSEKDLQLDAPGVDVQRFTGARSAYAFRYSGLRLLERSGGRLFLLPEGWTPESSRVIVIPDDNSLRIEFTR